MGGAHEPNQQDRLLQRQARPRTPGGHPRRSSPASVSVSLWWTCTERPRSSTSPAAKRCGEMLALMTAGSAVCNWASGILQGERHP